MVCILKKTLDWKSGEDLGALSDELRVADVGKRALIFFNLLFLKVPDYLVLINIDKVR